MPIVFTIFANPDGDLLLIEEQNGIQDALDPLVSAKKIEHLNRTSASREDFFNLVRNRPKNEFAILHFGGHAHQHVLQFQDTQVSFEEMAKEIVDHSRESLQLVFLNGCSTHALVDTLFDLGVPAVIATSVPVPDKKARDLAIHFYQHIALGDSIQSAYQSAVRYVNSPELDSARKIDESAKTRDIVLESAAAQTQNMKLREEATNIYRVYESSPRFFSRKDMYYLRPYQRFKACSSRSQLAGYLAFHGAKKESEEAVKRRGGERRTAVAFLKFLSG